jgi:quinol monooxygenase YgiN
MRFPPYRVIHRLSGVGHRPRDLQMSVQLGLAVDHRSACKVIFLVVKFPVRPDRSDKWLPLVADFTTATRAEPGNIFFEWSRSVDNPNQFVLVEAFRDRRAGEAHVNSDQFKTAMAWMPDAISDTPQIVNVKAPGDGWARMAELQPRRAH